MDLTAAISRNVRRIRKARGLTQREFAERVGVSLYTLINIEHSRPTSFSVLEQIADAFELDPAELVSTAVTERRPFMSASDIESVTADEFNALPPFKQAFYRAMAVQLDKLYNAPLNEAYAMFKLNPQCYNASI